MYHIRCGCFYNFASFRTQGGVPLAEKDKLTPNAIKLAEGRVCHGCWAAFTHLSLRLVFTTGTTTDNFSDVQQFEDLADVSGYSTIAPVAPAAPPGYVPPWADSEGAGQFIH